jgi:hypothetical protein
MRRVLTIAMIALCAVPLSAATVQATSGDQWPVTTFHRAWLVTRTGARHVAERAGSRVGGDSYRVQPQSACVRHSPFVVDCPFTYIVGNEAAENFERCHDIGRVDEVAPDQFKFTALKPSCRLINNETP